MRKKYEFSDRSLKRMEGVDPRLVNVFKTALAISPIDFGIPPYGGMRTQAEQRKLFVDGKSKCDGYASLSRHQEGKALDVYAYVGGKASWQKHHLSMIAGVILSVAEVQGLDVKWGGEFGSRTFNGWDFPHFEIVE